MALDTKTRFETKPLGPVGVEVLGLDVRRDLSEEDFAWLRQTVIDEGLVLFRDQPIDPPRQVALGRRFGVLEQLDLEAEDDAGAMIVIGNVDSEGRTFADDDPRMKLITINEGWHTDSSFRDVPASFSVFAAIVVPEEGGDTFFASLEAAWRRLAPEERVGLLGRIGVHDYDAAYRARGNSSGEVVGFGMPQTHHPLARRHPESGRVGLYVSEHVAAVEGLSDEQGRALLDRLLDVCTQEGVVYRHPWRVGDLAIWDNRSMLHRAQGFDQRFPRVMHHVRVSGSERPIPATAVD